MDENEKPSQTDGGNMRTADGGDAENTGAAETVSRNVTRGADILSLHSGGCGNDVNPFMSGFLSALNEN